MPEALDIGYAIGLPPRQAIDYFKSKGHQISWNWWEVWEASNAQSFTVAKAMKLDILSDIKHAQLKALEEGQTLKQFTDDLEPILRQKGWWGKKRALGPDGVEEIVQLGSPHRLRTIYDTHMRTARAQSHYHSQIAAVEEFPYWQYEAMDDLRTRPHHAALDGLVFRWDDPIWRKLYPPNGFFCRCRVRALSAAQVEAEGLKVLDSREHLEEIMQRVGVDRQTGEIIRRRGTQYTTPDGTPVAPDPGWSYNPGDGWPFEPSDLNSVPGPAPDPAAFWLLLARRRKAPGTAPTPIPESIESRPATKVKPVRLLPTATRTEAVEQFYKATRDENFQSYPITLPNGKVTTAYAEVTTPPGLENVILTQSFLEHLINDHPLEQREKFANYIIQTLRDPAEVWRQTAVMGGREVFQDIYLALFHDINSVLIVQDKPKYGSLAWTFFPANKIKHINSRRKGTLIYGKSDG